MSMRPDHLRLSRRLTVSGELYLRVMTRMDSYLRVMTCIENVCANGHAGQECRQICACEGSQRGPEAVAF